MITTTLLIIFQLLVVVVASIYALHTTNDRKSTPVAKAKKVVAPTKKFFNITVEDQPSRKEAPSSETVLRIPTIAEIEQYSLRARREREANKLGAKPLTSNQLVELIEAYEHMLNQSHIYTLRVAYGLEDVPFNVDLKDSLQWICEQLGLVSNVGDKSYLKVNFTFKSA